jgi:hypothetical protein
LIFDFLFPWAAETKPNFPSEKQIIDFDAIRASPNFVEELNQVTSAEELIKNISHHISQNSRVVTLPK